MWWSEYWPMPFMFFGPIMMIIFVVLGVALLFLLMRRGSICYPREGSAVDILKERFARGEIDQAEYEKRRRLLEA
jgi:putative membrane protein